MWIGEDEVKRGIVKIKSLSKHEEYEIKREELLEKIVQIVADNPVLLPQALQQIKGGKKEDGKEEKKE